MMMKLKFFLIFIGLNIVCFNSKSQNSEWNIVAEKIEPNNYYGITVANGVIGLVSSSNPLKVKDVILNGVSDNYGRGRVSNILKGFNFMNMDFFIDDIYLDAKNIQNFTQMLNMQFGELITTFSFMNKAKITHRLMALRHLPYSSFSIVEVEALQDIEILPQSVIEAPEILKDVKNIYAEIDRPHIKISLMTSYAKSPTGKINLAASNTFIFEEKHNETPMVIHEDWDQVRHLIKFRKKLKKGSKYVFSVIGSTCTSVEYQDPLNEAERLTIYALLEGREKLLKRHQEEWLKLWESDIIIDGDIETQRDIHSAIYHLYSFSREGTSYSPSPMGLSGLGYNGHVFWDTELWMFPAVLMLKPEMAKSMIEFRYKNLDLAKKNAFSHGFKGAMYPWESDETGQEVTPVWALSGPFEHHISGCVAFATWKYFQVTRDTLWLKEKGFKILKEVADFWTSRVEIGNDNKFHINNVVAADEWAENVDDNAFTNAVAILSLKYANEAAILLNINPNPKWNETAKNINILKNKEGIILEHLNYNGEQIKQADVDLLSYPLGFLTDENEIKKNANYYEPKIGKGPAMSYAIYSIINNRLGNYEKGYELFKKAYIPNLNPPFRVIAETAGGTNPYFATGAGGMLQAVLAGFLGLDINDHGIVQKFKVKLPSKWKSIKGIGIGINKETFEIINK